MQVESWWFQRESVFNHVHPWLSCDFKGLKHLEMLGHPSDIDSGSSNPLLTLRWLNTLLWQKLPVEIDDLWWSMMIYDDLWWPMMIYDDLWWSMLIYGDLWWSMMIYVDLWWFSYYPDAPWCWNMYLHLPQTWPSFVGEYSSTMEHLAI